MTPAGWTVVENSWEKSRKGRGEFVLRSVYKSVSHLFNSLSQSLENETHCDRVLSLLAILFLFKSFFHGSLSLNDEFSLCFGTFRLFLWIADA